jgi:hypothetical protein
MTYSVVEDDGASSLDVNDKAVAKLDCSGHALV